MPEGDTLWRTAAALRPRIAGQVVRRAAPPRLSALTGLRVESVESAGKHLLMRFDGGLTLHSHMRMTGSWHLYAPGQPWQVPPHRARAVLEFDDTVAVCFSAPVVELVRDEQGAIGHLGPDILAPGFAVDAVVTRARQSEDETLGELLLNQRVCAGIGNIYKCETLWHLGLDPWLAPAEVDDAQLGRCFAVARDLMRTSAAGAGFRRRPAVHGRGGRPCPRCQDPVKVLPQGAQGRLTYYCATCQRAGQVR